MKFSERKGYKEIKTQIQLNEIDATLRIGLWNVLDREVWEIFDFGEGIYSAQCDDLTRYIWENIFKLPVDERDDDNPKEQIKDYFMKCNWYEVYDFIEDILSYDEELDLELQQEINQVLEEELSGYRFVNGICTDITKPEEIEMLEEVLNDDEFPGVKIHLNQALEHLSNKKNPDFRNSIKESISAVESMAQYITGNSKSTLGEALKSLEKNNTLHPALTKGFLSIYGYVSDADGIRHAILEETTLTVHDAKFFLLSCTSFINYLKTKI